MEEYYYNYAPTAAEAYGIEKKRRIARQKRHKRRKAVRKATALLVIAFIVATFAGQTPVSTALLKARGCPDEIIEITKAHPGTFGNAWNWYELEFQESSIDITKEVFQENIPNFQQWDKRWGYKHYGNGYMALNGCGPTCLSMVYCGRTDNLDWNPLKMAQWANDNGYYIEGIGTSWNLMDDGAQQLGLSVQTEVPSEENIREALQQDKTIICIMNAGDFTSTGHYIVLSEITKHDRVKVNDPNSRWRSFRKWNVSTIAEQARQMWVYE